MTKPTRVTDITFKITVRAGRPNRARSMSTAKARKAVNTTLRWLCCKGTQHATAMNRKQRKVATQPLCVGFGISTSQQAKRVARIADGVIVGSQLIQLMGAEDNFIPSVNSFITGLRCALDESPGDQR